MDIRIKNIHEEPKADDGMRIYVERSWPLDMTKGEAEVDLWLKEIAPGEGIQTLFSGRPERWGEFECMYFAELDGRYGLVSQVLQAAARDTVTLLHDSGNPGLNSAAAIKDYIEAKKDWLAGRAA